MASVELIDVQKAFGKVQVIKGVNLKIEDGEFVVFVGPSGCGKSTLLRLIAGLEDVSDGLLKIDNQVVNHLSPKEREIGMVFQSYALYPHMSVYDNMAFGLQLSDLTRETVAQRVGQTAKILQLEELLERKPRELSGGQRQRVAMGRAMVREPSILLLDEPLSNLDAALRVQMRTEIKKLHERLQSTMVYVTHDQVEAMTLADKIVVLNSGVVEQVGSPFELYEKPATTFVATFIGSPKMNMVDGRIVETGQRNTVIEIPQSGHLQVPVDSSALNAGAEITLGIRPEKTSVIADAEATGLEVVNIEYLGNESFVYFAEPGMTEPLLARVPVPSGVSIGQNIRLRLTPEHSHVFNRDGKALARVALRPLMT